MWTIVSCRHITSPSTSRLGAFAQPCVEIMIKLPSCLEEKGGLSDNTGNEVRVAVRGGTTVLEVTVALCGNVTGDTDGSTTVGNTGREVANVAGLVPTGKTLVVVGTVNGDVLVVSLGELLNGSLDGLHTTLLAHRLGRVVGVATSSVPVTGDGLGVERDLDTPLLGHSDEEVTGEGEVVTHLDTLARADLELPLGGHDLGVDTRDVDTGVEAGAVVSLDEVTGKDLTGTSTTVVRALGTRETSLGPAERTVVHVKERVLLLETEPRLLSGNLGHDLVALVSVVGLIGGAIVVVALGKNDDVVTTTERVGVVGSGTEVDIRVTAGGLVGGGTVEVPLLEILERLDGAVEGGGLASDLTCTGRRSRRRRFQAYCQLSRSNQGRASCMGLADWLLAGRLHEQDHRTASSSCWRAELTIAVNPDVLGHDLATLVKLEVRADKACWRSLKNIRGKGRIAMWSETVSVCIAKRDSCQNHKIASNDGYRRIATQLNQLCKLPICR